MRMSGSRGFVGTGLVLFALGLVSAGAAEPPDRVARRAQIVTRMTVLDVADVLTKPAARACVEQDNAFLRVSPLTEMPGIVRGIVEIPRGHRNKYELDVKTGLIRLDRYVAGSVAYPVDYGVFPQTLGGDGDPLDLLLVVHEPTFPGCLVEMRILGLLAMEEKGDEDIKVIGVPSTDPHFASWKELGDVPTSQLAEIEHFFNTYKQLEGGRVQTFGWAGAREGRTAVEACHRRYLEARRMIRERRSR